MTGQIILSCRNPGAWSGIELAVQIQSLDRTAGKNIEAVMPGHGAALAIAVNPGRHLVRLILPTGRILQQRCAVDDGGSASVAFDVLVGSDDKAFQLRSRVERLDAETTPRAWPISVLANIGSLLPAVSLASLQTFPLMTLLDRQLTRLGVATLAALPLGRRSNATLRIVSPIFLQGVEGWARAGVSPLTWHLMLAKAEAVAPRVREGALSFWRIDASDLPEVNQNTPSRSWFVTRVGDQVELGSLPSPWRVPDSTETASVDVLVDAAASAQAASTIAIQDPRFEGLLAYLAQGQLGASRPLVKALADSDHIEEALREKTANPLAACAAGYAALALFDPGQSQRWDPWFANLANWFPWLPDGGILHARRMLLRPESGMKPGTAREVLKRAFRAGIPYFSTGVELLRDMLSILAEDDAEANDMLAKVSAIASRTDPRQIFTVLRYPANVT
jgi:hypothetical protein